MKKIITALAAVAAMAAGSAFAQSAYITGAIGQAKADVDCAGTTRCDDTDTAWKIIGGYKFTPMFAGELTYFDYGKVEASVGPSNLEIKTRGIGLGIAAMMDFTPQWSGVARLGVVSNRAKLSSNVGLSGSETKAEPYVGVGVGYAFTPQLKLDAALDFSRARHRQRRRHAVHRQGRHQHVHAGPDLLVLSLAGGRAACGRLPAARRRRRPACRRSSWRRRSRGGVPDLLRQGMPATPLANGIPAAGATALLIIDMISSWRFPDALKLRPQAARIAPAIAALKARCRRAGVPVIYANDNHGMWRSDFRHVVADALAQGGPGARLTEQIAPDEDDYFVLKPKHSGFFGTPLDLLLQHLQVHRLIVTGVASDQCVTTTAVDARMRDYEVVAPADCIATHSAARNRRALRHFEEALRVPTTPAPRLRLPRARQGAAGG